MRRDVKAPIVSGSQKQPSGARPFDSDFDGAILPAAPSSGTQRLQIIEAVAQVVGTGADFADS
jgi:hypothetical protein